MDQMVLVAVPTLLMQGIVKEQRLEVFLRLEEVLDQLYSQLEHHLHMQLRCMFLDGGLPMHHILPTKQNNMEQLELQQYH
jgi:hypothetical protein